MKHWGNSSAPEPRAHILVEGEGPQGYDLCVYAVAPDGTRFHIEGVTKAEWSTEGGAQVHTLILHVYNTAFTIKPDP